MPTGEILRDIVGMGEDEIAARNYTHAVLITI